MTPFVFLKKRKSFNKQNSPFQTRRDLKFWFRMGQLHSSSGEARRGSVRTGLRLALVPRCSRLPGRARVGTRGGSGRMPASASATSSLESAPGRLLPSRQLLGGGGGLRGKPPSYQAASWPRRTGLRTRPGSAASPPTATRSPAVTSASSRWGPGHSQGRAGCGCGGPHLQGAGPDPAAHRSRLGREAEAPEAAAGPGAGSGRGGGARARGWRRRRGRARGAGARARVAQLFL